MLGLKLALEATSHTDGHDSGSLQIGAQRAGNLDVPVYGGFEQGDGGAGGYEEAGSVEVVLGETSPGTQFEFSQRADDAGLDSAFEDEIVGDNRAGFDDAVGGHADGAGGLERAGPAAFDGVIADVQHRPALRAVDRRGFAMELELVAALVTFDELFGGNGGVRDGRAELLKVVRRSARDGCGSTARLDCVLRGFDRGVTVNDAGFSWLGHRSQTTPIFGQTRAVWLRSVLQCPTRSPAPSPVPGRWASRRD